MVISDFNIICLNQSIPTLIPHNGIGIDIISPHNGYGHHWKALKKSKGVWYQLFPLEREITGQYNDEFFDLIIQNTDYQAIALKKYRVDLKEFVDEYLTLSPIHEILVLIRLDEHGESKKIARMKFTDFTKNLDTGKLLFNKIYRVVK